MADEMDDGAATADITLTPEFEMALEMRIAAERDKMYREVMEDVRRTAVQPTAPSSAGMTEDTILSFARAIAMSNAELADQGTNRKRLSPETLEVRAKAETELLGLLETCARMSDDDPDLPVYRVISRTYIGDRVIDPYTADPTRKGVLVPQQVIFCSKPNMALEPVNDTAKAIFSAYERTMAGGSSVQPGISTPDPLNDKPLWMTDKGRLLSTPTATAMEHGMVSEPVRVTADMVRARPVQEIISPHDPRASKIPVTGTIAPPAVRGSIDARVR